MPAAEKVAFKLEPAPLAAVAEAEAEAPDAAEDPAREAVDAASSDASVSFIST